MKRMLSRMISMLVVLAIAASLIGCGGNPANTDNGSSTEPTDSVDNSEPTAAVSTETPPPEPTPDLTPDKKTIKVNWFVPWWEQASMHKYVFDEFARLYPEYELDHTVYSSDIQQLAASIQAGTQADVWVGGDPNWAQYVTAVYQGLLEPLDDFLKYDPDYNFNTVNQSALNTCKFVDGRYYAVPYEIAANILVWNKDIFARSGLDPEKPPETWSEFYEYAQQILRTDSNGVPTQLGYYGPLPTWVYEALRKDYHVSQDGTKSRFNEPFIKEADEFCGKFETIYGGPEKLPNGVQFNINNGNVAMETGNLTQLNGYAKQETNFGFGLLPRPDDYPEQVLPGFLWMYIGIPKGCQNPKGGWLFLKYAVTQALVLKGEKEYQDNPSRWFPSYIAHTPTREKIYNLFLTTIDEDVREMIEKRDQMVDNINYYYPNTPIKMRLQELDGKWWDKFVNGEVNENERYEGLHTEFQAELDQWKKDMINKGWQFPDGGAPIPPWN